MSSANLILEPGKRVSYEGRSCRIAKILSLQEVVLVDEATHETVTAAITSLQAATAELTPQPDLNTISDQAWILAKQRLAIITNPC